MSKRNVAIIVFLVVFVAVFCFRRFQRHYRTMSGVVWTTEYHITYESRVCLDDSVQAVFELIDCSASKYNAKSQLSRINRNETDTLDAILLRLYQISEEVHRITGGAYDPTVSPLANVWGFGLRTGVRPDSVAIDSLMAFVGLDKTSVTGELLTKTDNRITFDFNSIAKGFACDEVGRMLARNGVENYVVEIGGEVSARGHSERGQEWRVSVDRPIESSDTVIHESAFVISLSSGGVASSGNYRNFRVVDGRKVGHIINPHTGYPEATDLLSVTVVAADCATADAYATGLMVLGYDSAREIADEMDSIGVSLTRAAADGSVAVWENASLRQMMQE